jgi:hypothetical protein
MVSQYNDTTFVSKGWLHVHGATIFLADEQNKFVAIADTAFGLKKFIPIGQGNGRLPAPMISKVLFASDKVYIPMLYQQKIYIYDRAGNYLSVLRLDDVAARKLIDPTTPDREAMYLQNDSTLICLTRPGSAQNFLSFNLHSREFTFLNSNKSLHELKGQNSRNMQKIYCLMNNGIFVGVTYDYLEKKGILHIFSVFDEQVERHVDIPLNKEVKDIIYTYGRAPAFDRVSSLNDRCFIAFNAFGLVTAAISQDGAVGKWTFLHYPDKLEDHMVLRNFCVTDECLYFFNEGEIKVYKNPL